MGAPVGEIQHGQRDARVGAHVLQAPAALVHVHEHPAAFPVVPCRDRHGRSVRAHGGDDRRVRLRQEGVEPRRKGRARHAASLAPTDPLPAMPSDPPTYAPMLAGTSQNVPPGDAWRFEIKWDGFRAIARVRGDDVRLWSRNGKSLDAQARRGRRGAARRAHAARLRARRRAVRVRRERRPELRAVPARRGRDRLRRLRPARARRRAALRRALEPAARAAREADPSRARPSIVLSQVYDDGEALLDAARAARPRGRHGQARERALPAGPPQRRLAQDQAAPGGHAADRRLHERPGRARAASARSCSRPTTSSTPATAAAGCRMRTCRELLERARAAAPRRPRRCAARPTGAASPARASPGSSRRSRARWSSPSGRASAGCARPSSSASSRRVP